MTAPGVQITPEAAARAGLVLAAASDAAAAAGSALFAAAASVTGHPQAGSTIGSAASTFGEVLARTCADLVESAEGLGGAVQAGAQAYTDSDDAVSHHFGAMVPR